MTRFLTHNRLRVPGADAGDQGRRYDHGQQPDPDRVLAHRVPPQMRSRECG